MTPEEIREVKERLGPGPAPRRSPFVPTAVHLERDTLPELDAAAQAAGLSRSAAVREAVRRWLKPRRRGARNANP